MSNTLTRASLANLIYNEIGISYSESSKIIDIFFDELTQGLIDDKVVKISSFGSFYLKSKKARIGRNPKTKEEYVINSRNVVSFYSSKILKDIVNS